MADGDRIAAACILMIYSGMMPGELFALELPMIQWDRNAIVGCGLKTKKRKEQPIVFPDLVKPVLEDLCNTSPSAKGRVLGMNRDNFYKSFNAMKERLRIRTEIRPYSGRHSTSTSLAVANVPIALIVEIMRQKNYTTTLKHYNQLDTKDLVAALNELKPVE